MPLLAGLPVLAEADHGVVQRVQEEEVRIAGEAPVAPPQGEDSLLDAVECRHRRLRRTASAHADRPMDDLSDSDAPPLTAHAVDGSEALAVP